MDGPLSSKPRSWRALFFTLTLKDRRSDLLVRHIDILRWAFTKTRRRWPFAVDAIVILPDHLHAVWVLPEGDDDYPARWRAIKAEFTRALRKRLSRSLPSPWQARYWEHTLRDEDDHHRHVEYIHFNPVKHGYVTRPGDWPHSSFHRYVEAGIYPEDWAGCVTGGRYGE